MGMLVLSLLHGLLLSLVCFSFVLALASRTIYSGFVVLLQDNMLSRLLFTALLSLTTVFATPLDVGLEERQSGCTAQKRLAGAKLIVNSYNKVGSRRLDSHRSFLMCLE